MTDYSELRRLAEACGNLNWRFQQENWTEYAIRDDHGYIATMRVGSPKQSGPDPDREAKAKFLGAMTPGAILALIAENDGLRDGLSDIAKKASESRSLTRRLTWIEGRAESALLGKPWAAHVFMMPDPKNGKPKAERLEAENKQLRAEVEALRKGLADARYRIEQGRVWAGTKWQLTGLHPHGQQKALDAIDAAMSSGDKSGG